MSVGPELRVGIVGYGLMGKAHSYGYRVAPMLRRLPVTPVVTVMSGRDGDAVAAAALAYEVPLTVTDWRELIERDDVDVVDICTPPGTHAQIAIAAAAAGKAVLCEKPLALTYEEAAAALAAVTRAGVHHAVGFNYRRLPAVALMCRLIAEGAVGEIRLWRASWLSDEFTDPATPYELAVRPGHRRHHDHRPRLPPHRHGADHGRSGAGHLRAGRHVHLRPPDGRRRRERAGDGR